MIIKPILSPKRHLVKTITWRIFSSFITFFIALVLFNKTESASQKVTGIVLLEGASKMLLYFLHERIWYRINFKTKISSHVRHILKSVSYRIWGSIITTIATFVFFHDDPEISLIVSKLIILEIIIKLLSYYIHERIWYRINFGVIKKENG